MATLEIDSPARVKERNQRLLAMLDTPGHEKDAGEAISSYTKTTLREDSFTYRLMDPLPIPDSELTPQVTTDKPSKVLEMEPGSPAAVSLPFGEMPLSIHIQVPRYLATFDRVISPRVYKDMAELRTYQMDVRQVISDNMNKDMLAEVDTKFIGTVNTALMGLDTVQPITGVAQWRSVGGGIERETVIEVLKFMPQTPFRLETHTVLVNTLFLMEMMKWGRDEMGGNLSEEVLVNGWNERTFLGRRWISTIKRDLIPDTRMYCFADPRAIGKMFILEEPTMFVKKEAYLIDFFLYMTIGGALANVAGMTIGEFNT